MSHLHHLLFVSLFFSISPLKLPSYIEKACGRHDPNLDDCVVKRGRFAIPKFIHGDPKYRVPELDPLDIEELSLHQGTRQVGLDLVIRNCKMYGLSHALFTASRMDLKKGHVEWDFVNDFGLQIIGDYNISGQVLVVPITGSGKANITIGPLTSTYIYEFDLIKKKDKKEYIQVKSGSFRFNTSRVYFKLSNLFNGDRLLGNNMNEFLNENWRELMKEFGPTMGQALAEVFNRLLRNILGLVPYDLVYPDSV